MRKKLKIILIVLVTIGCIALGLRNREKNGILVTSIATQAEDSLGYMLETSENNIIMIDGGSYEDSQHLENILKEKGGVVDRWFITLAHPENFGAMQRILENGNIEIKNIYISFNGADWYAKNEPENYAEVAQFLDLIYSDEIIKKVYNVPLKFEMLVDNLYFTVLNVCNPEIIGEEAGYNQSMILKVNNTYKSMIFLGNIGKEGALKFRDNNLDEIDCDAVQMSTRFISFGLYKRMTVDYVFTPGNQEQKSIDSLRESFDIENVYTGDTTVKIW